MGMYDTLYDESNNEWQTKAFLCCCDQFNIGDKIPNDFPAAYPTTYQVEILGGGDADPYTDSYATIQDGVLVSVNDNRDGSLPLINYSGHLTETGV